MVYSRVTYNIKNLSFIIPLKINEILLHIAYKYLFFMHEYVHKYEFRSWFNSNICKMLLIYLSYNSDFCS